MAQIQELLSRELKVQLRARDTEERSLNVRICIELQSSAGLSHKKDLVVRMTDDTDPFFLYNLVISEEDFQSLKTQQGLLVDFSAFPQKFIDLLYQCIQEERKEVPRFLLQLSPSASVLGNSPAQLDIIETNPFKHLTHLSLRLLPASDLEIKSYLANCLRCIKEEKHLLQQTLKKTEEDLSRQLTFTQQSLSEKCLELERIKSESSAMATALTSKHSVELASEKENAQKTRTQLVQQYEQQRKELESSLQKNTEMMQSRLAELETSNKELLERRFKAESTIRELRAKYQGLEEESKRTQQKVVGLQRENSALDAECHEKEKEANRLQTRLAVLEQELKDKEQLLLRSSEVLKATQEQKASLETSSEKKRVQIGKLEATIKSLSSELLKANDIIKKLQGDLRNLMGKLKLKNAVTVQQEKLLADKEKQIQEEQKLRHESEETLHVKEEEANKLQERLQEAEQKLQESKELLKTNENVINWLNKQLNENQCAATNPINAPFSTAMPARQPPENRLAFHASRTAYPLSSSYPVKPNVSSTVGSHQSTLEAAYTVPKVQYNNQVPKPNMPGVIPQGPPGLASSTNKENGEISGLDLKYLKKREVGFPLRGLNQNLPTAKATQTRTGALLTQSAYFPGQTSSS
ncbi:spindle assembly abnormal protein 6 homolog [Spea bombifrons]|uniref:spindle assembly abnormal protein 6 homolog n=1 Tax=Spea bombifrons TaxID=233779 RepID=UPI00234AA85A|nr:spindle assembly abnormal protein 6 homolog [Spea bombifrons]